MLDRYEPAPSATGPDPHEDTLTEDGVPMAELDSLVTEVAAELKSLQKDDGHWVFELEADATIPSEYILLEHFLDEVDETLESELAEYIRSQQGDHGGWALFYDGDFDISATVKAYYALKLVGDSPDEEHMVRAREAILARGGAERTNVFTRYALALFGQVPWLAVPVMPVELMLLPKWFPVNMWRFSYWSRTVIAPLLILAALKPKARNPRNVHIRELFREPPEKIKKFLDNPTGSPWGELFLHIDRILRVAEPKFPRGSRDKAIKKAVAFIRERLNGEDGLGAIFPAMANTVMAFDALGYAKDDPDLEIAKASINKLITTGDWPRYCQPCVSPIWDTGLGVQAMMEAEGGADGDNITAALDWLQDRQILDVKGDWATKAPDLRPGGWAFQYNNDHYPDVDDTAVVAMALDRAKDPKYAEALERAAEWVIGMQSANGGWGAFDIDNTSFYLNHIPFADHGALLDPPTADVSARCVSMLAQMGYGRDHTTVARGLGYLKREQEADGSWYGRWGTNYVYGTWSVLCAFNAVDEDMSAPHIRKAVDWLLARQHDDGGWGEDGATYWGERRTEAKESTPSQTAWAVLGLMAAGEVDHPAVARGIKYLMAAPRDGARWEEPWFTAVGFPRVFYLRYHGYAAYFPLWALARYRSLKRGNSRRVAYGM